MNTEKELKERMEEAIFIHTTSRKENEKIAGICADIAVRFFSSNAMLADSAVFTKEQVMRIVAEFGRSYNTESFLGDGKTLEEAIEEVKDLIKWDV